MRYSLAAAVFGLISLVVGFSSGRAIAANIPPDDIDPVFRDLLCVLDPSHDFCPGCPPYCLNKIQNNMKAFSKRSASAVKEAGIVSRAQGNRVVIANRRGGSVSLTCRNRPLPKDLVGKTSARRLVHCNGAVGNKTFTWQMTFPLDRSVSREGAIEFKRFVGTARPLFSDELTRLQGGRTQAAGAPLLDYVLCGVVAGGVTSVSGPVAGGAVGGLCTWFASNGLD